MSKPDIETEEFKEAMLELRNTPDASGKSPNELIFGHNLRSRVPAHFSNFVHEFTEGGKYDETKRLRAEKLKIKYDLTSKPLPEFSVGDPVLIQDHVNYKSVSYTHLTLPTNREV